jgi:hypothetical protein
MSTLVARDSCGAIQSTQKTIGRLAHLKGWINEPYMQEPVIAALKAAQWPLALREVAEAANVPLRPANRVLRRLCGKGLVARQKIALQRHAFCRKRWECVPSAARRMLYVYRWAGGAP